MILATFRGIDRVQANLHKTVKDLQPQVTRGMERATKHFEAAMKRNRMSAPKSMTASARQDMVRVRTGHLRSSVHSQVKVEGWGNIRGRVGTPLWYAEVLEHGTNSTVTIYPKAKRCLAFKWEGHDSGRTGKYKGMFCFKHVTQLPRAGKRLFAKELLEQRQRIQGFIKDSVVQVVRRANGR